MNFPDFHQAVEFLKQSEHFLVTSHINADGDSIGSSLATANMLNKMGKTTTVVLNDMPEGYDFLQGFDDIQLAGDPGEYLADTAIILDCPSLNRIGESQKHLAAEVNVLNIDHHKSNEQFGAVNIVSDTVCSTCEMVFHLCTEMGTRIDKTLAEQLYTGILFDTGGFRYSLTTAESHEVAAELIRHGARLDYISDRIYNNSSLNEVKLLGRAIDSLTLHANDRIAMMNLSNDDMRGDDPEGTVNYGLMIKTVEVAALLREEKPNQFRISLRSRDNVDVQSVAATFGGGGHNRAAGYRREGDLLSIKTEVLAALESALP